MRYEFNAYGNTLTVLASDIENFDAFSEMGDAMVQANRKLLWTNPDACEGEWELTDNTVEIQRYIWRERSSFLLSGGMLVTNLNLV